MFHPNLKRLSQIRPAHIESYQKQLLQSMELKITADGDKIGVHKNKRLPFPQTINFEYSALRSAFIWAHNHEMISSVQVSQLLAYGRGKGKVEPGEARIKELERDLAKRDQVIGELTIANRILKKSADGLY